MQNLHPKLLQKINELTKYYDIKIVKTIKTYEDFLGLPYKFTVIPRRYPYSSHCFGLAINFIVLGGNTTKIYDICQDLGLYITQKDNIYHIELKEFLPNQSVKFLMYRYKTPENFINSWSNS